MKNIFTIIKKELRAYFNNPTAYIVIVAFLVLWQFLFFRNVFQVGQASLRPLFDFLPWIFLIVIPALTMGSIAQEKSDGTMEFVLTLPIKEVELLIGKFLGSLIFLAIALLFVIPIAWSLGKFGNFDLGVIYGQYLASVLLASVLVSLGIFVSSLFTSQVSALMTAAIASFFLVISGFEIVTSRLPLSLVPYFEQLSVLTHFYSMARGVIDFRDIWYFVSVSAAFLSLSYLMLLRNKYGNQKKTYPNFQLATVLFVAIVIVTNVIGSRIPGRIDLTEEKSFTLSNTTKKIVSNLNDIVDVTFFVSAQLPSQLQPTMREVDDLLRDYQTLSKGNIIVTKKNPSDDPTVAREAMSLGVQEIRFNVVSQEELQVKTGYLGVAVSYGGEHESIPFVENTYDLEYQLTSFINKLTVQDKKKLVFVTGDGEKNPNVDARFLGEELKKQFEVATAALQEPPSDEEEPAAAESSQEEVADKTLSIPDDTDVLVVAGTGSDLGQQPLEEIKNFVTNGGNAMFLVDQIDVMPQMLSASPVENGLAPLLDEQFGIMVNPNIAYDLQSNETVSFSGGVFPLFLSYPFWVRSVKSDQPSPVTANVESIVFPWASSITISSKEGVEDTILLTTTEAGGIQTGQFNISPEQKFTREGLKAYPLAAAATLQNDGTSSRIIVAGDSDFITDQYVRNNAENLAFTTEALSWLAQEESLAEIQLKNKTERKLVFDQKGDPSKIKFGNMAFALIVPAGYGALRIMRRRKMKQKHYQK